MERQMASLLYTCPETRQQAPTGIQIDARGAPQGLVEKTKGAMPVLWQHAPIPGP